MIAVGLANLPGAEEKAAPPSKNREGLRARDRSQFQERFLRARNARRGSGLAPLELRGLRNSGASREGVQDSNGAFAPEEVGGKAEEEEGDGNGKEFELRGVEEGKNDGVADDCGGDEDEDERCQRISGAAIGKRPAV